MRIGMKVAVGLTVLLALLAMAASVFLALDEYRNYTERPTYLEAAGLIEAPFVFGVALLIASVGLVKSQNWARIQVVVSALLFAGCLCVLSLLAFTQSKELRTQMLVPMLALPGCLACLWLALYVSVAQSHFPSLFSRSSKMGCALATACVLACPVLLAVWMVATVVWNVTSDMRHPPPPRPSPPAAEQITAKLQKVLAQVPSAEHVAPERCPDSEILGASTELEKAKSYFGPVAFVWPILYDAQAAPWQPAAGWEWLTDPAIRRLPLAKDYDLRALGRLRYLAVLRSVERSLPETLNRGQGVVHFRPGTFRGAIFIMDMERAVVVCQAPLDVRSSPQLEYSSSGALAKSAQEALTLDFKERFLERARSATGEVSRVVRVSLSLEPD